MPAARRRTSTYAVVLSAGVHLAIAVALWIHAPRLRVPVETAGPPEPIIPVLIMPRAPPVATEPGAAPSPIRLHRRPQRFAPAETPVAPMVVPEKPVPVRTPVAPAAPRTVTSPEAEAVGVNARQALQASLGCSNPDAFGLTKAQREKCNERLGAGGRDQADLGLGLDRDKAGGLARDAARKDAEVRYRNSAPTSPRAPGATSSGASADDLARSLGNEKSKLTVPF